MKTLLKFLISPPMLILTLIGNIILIIGSLMSESYFSFNGFVYTILFLYDLHLLFNPEERLEMSEWVDENF